MEKLRSEGVLTSIINDLPLNKKTPVSLQNQMQPLGATTSKPRAGTTHAADRFEQIDPNRRYLSCTVVKGSAFADFVNVRSDESLSIAVSFLKNRYHTRQVQCSTDPVYDESFLFEF